MKKSVTIVLVLMLVVFGGGIYFFFQVRDNRAIRHAHGAFKTETDAMRSAGIPLETKDLQAPPASPDQDAGPIYAQIAVELKTHPLKGSDAILKNSLGSSITPTAQQTADAHVAVLRNERLLAQIHLAATRPQCVLQINWKNPNFAAIEFPQFATIRLCARAVTVESYDLAAQGRMHEAIQTQALGFKLANHAYTGRTTIASLTAIAIDSITMTGFHRILDQSHGDPKVAQEVFDAIEQNYRSLVCSDAVKTEMTTTASYMQYLRGAGPSALNIDENSAKGARPPDKTWVAENHRAWNAYLDSNSAMMLGNLRRQLPIVDQPFPISHPKLLANAAEFDARLKKAGPSAMLAEMFYTDPTSYASKKTMIDADVKMVKTAARLFVAESKSGEFPAGLSELPKEPIDPFTGQPLHYRRESHGFVLYSVGEHETIDGVDSPSKPITFPRIFRYPAPAETANEKKTKKS